MIKIGFIGAGRWAAPYALSAGVTGFEITGIYAPDDTSVKLAERVHSKAIDDPRKVIEQADFVLIGSPTDTHTDYLTQAIRADKPAFCSSPVVADVSEIEKLQSVLKGNVKTFASFPLRTRPEYRNLKQTLSDEKLGRVGMIRLGMCRQRPSGWRRDEKRGGGPLLDMGVHLIDSLEWLAGPVERIYGASTGAGENQYNLLVARMKSGTIAHIEISWAEANGVCYDYYEVAGSNGLLDYDSRREPLLVVDYLNEQRTDVLSPGATSAENEMRSISDHVKGTGVSGDLVTLEGGLEVCRKAVQIKHAIEAGEVLIF